MFRQAQHDKLLVIVGPTASGKSALGLKLAEKYSGEIINADSRSVYRYMDIGTAKPTQKEMLLIPHHLVNIRNPDESFSVSDFKVLAQNAMDDIVSRGKLPIMVGGTGLYIDSVLFDYQFPGQLSDVKRQMLLKLSHEQLLERLLETDLEAFERVDLKNPRRVIRAIETAGAPRSKSTDMRESTLVLGLSLNKQVIQDRIHRRIEKMLSQGLIDEVARVGQQFGWDNEAMTGPAYRAFRGVIEGDVTTEEASKEFAARDLSLAKRQMTWFKRNHQIKWLEAEDSELLYREADQLVEGFLTSDM